MLEAVRQRYRDRTCRGPGSGDARSHNHFLSTAVHRAIVSLSTRRRVLSVRWEPEIYFDGPVLLGSTSVGERQRLLDLSCWSATGCRHGRPGDVMRTCPGLPKRSALMADPHTLDAAGAALSAMHE